MGLQAIGNRIIVKRLETEETVNGIIIPDAAKKKQDKAVVVSVSEDCKIDVHAGNVIFMDKYAGQEITDGEQTYLILPCDNVLAVLV